MDNPFKTGRHRSFTLSGSMSGMFASVVQFVPVGTPSNTHQQNSYGSMLVNWGPGPSYPNVSWGIGSGGITVVAQDGLGNSSEGTASIPYSSGKNYAFTADGTWSFSLSRVEEWEGVYEQDSITTIDGYDFPNQGGSAQGDSIPSAWGYLSEIAPIGAVLTISVSYGGASTTLTTTLTAPMDLGYIQNGILNQTAETTDIAYNAAATLTYDSSTPLPSFSEDVHQVGYGETTVSTSGSTVTITCVPDIGAAVNGAVGTWNGEVSQTTEFDLSARLRCFESAFPGSMVLEVTEKSSAPTAITINPNCTASWSQNFYALDVQVQNETFTPALDERCPVSAWLSGFGSDDSNDWRCHFRGYQWPAMTIARSGNVTIDPCTATTHWTAGAHTALSVSGGSLAAAASGGVGSLTLAVQSAVRVWEAFRFLSITAEATTEASSPPATIPLTVSLAGQTWTISVPVGSSAAELIDLTIAGNEASTKNQKTSRFPIKNPGGGPINTDPQDQYKMGWGVDYCDSIGISGIPDGYTVTFGGIDLALSGTDKEQAITILEPFLSFLAGWTSDSDNTTVQPFVLIQTDHRVSDVGVGMALVSPIGSGSPTFRYFAITEVIQFLQYLPGLTVTQLGDPSDGYHNAELFAFMLAGSGSTVNQTTGTWTDWIDVSMVGESITIPAQDIFDQVSVYPGCGNPWTEGAAYGGATPLRITKFVRGQAWGEAYEQSNVPYPSSNVVVFETATPSTVEGSAVTGTFGEFETQTPWGFGNVDTTTQFQQGEMPYLSEHSVWQNRLRIRSAFRQASDVAKPIGYDVSKSFRHCRTYTRPSTGSFFLGCASNLLPQSWNDLDSTISATWARCRFQDLGQQAPIGVFYGDGTNCHWARTYDEGQHYQDTIDMSSGILGDYEEDGSGAKWFFKIQLDGSSYNVYNKILDNQLNTVRDWTITTVTGIDDSSLATRSTVRTDGQWQIILFYSSGGSALVMSSSDGINFS